MTAPISNEPTTTRLHHYAGRYFGLTTFVTTRTRAPQKLNTRDPHDTHRKRRARLRFPWAVAGPGRASRRKAWPRCRWVAAGPGRASRSTTPSAARVWRSRGRAAAHRHTQRPGPTKQPGPTRRPEHPWRHKQHHHSGGPPPTGTHSGRALRRPEHQRGHKPQPGKTKTADPEGSAVSSCARGELNPHSITGTRT